MTKQTNIKGATLYKQNFQTVSENLSWSNYSSLQTNRTSRQRLDVFVVSS